MPDQPANPAPEAAAPDPREAALVAAHALREQRAPLAHRLAFIAGAVARLPKTKQAPTGGGGTFRYTPIEDMAAAITGLCAAAGVAMLPMDVDPLAAEADWRDPDPTKQRTRWRYLYRVTWLVTDGTEQLRVQTMGEALDWGDKASNKALTGARKYLYQLLFHLQTGDDPDAEHGADPPAERGDRPAQQARRQAARQRQAPASGASSPQGASAPAGGTQGTPQAPEAPQEPAAPALTDDDRRKVRRRRAALARGEQDQTIVAAWLAQHGVTQLRQLLDAAVWLRLCTAAGVNPADPLPPDPDAAPAEATA